jgi:chromosome segregation ATPase
MARETKTMVAVDAASTGGSGVQDPALLNADGTAENPKQKELQRHLALLEENKALENRLQELQQALHKTYHETSLLKMKSIMTIGSMKLEIDSLNEDRQFLIQKYHGLKRRIEEYRNDLTAKEEHLAELKAKRRERTHSI